MFYKFNKAEYLSIQGKYHLKKILIINVQNCNFCSFLDSSTILRLLKCMNPLTPNFSQIFNLQYESNPYFYFVLNPTHGQDSPEDITLQKQVHPFFNAGFATFLLQEKIIMFYLHFLGVLKLQNTILNVYLKITKILLFLGSIFVKCSLNSFVVFEQKANFKFIVANRCQGLRSND